MKSFRFILILAIIYFLIGCTTQDDTSQTKDGTNFQKIAATDTVSQHIANQAKEKLKKREAITKINAINTDKKLLIAFEIKHHKRFQLDSIRKKINKQMEKAFPDHKVQVSTDKRIVLDLQKLEKKIANGKLTKKQLRKKAKQEIKLMKDKT
ncbi:YhcN/YlaJ family sporulation lipoprotein [Lentibacillus cibarius]|uniref:Sporulation protein n=1 Tax=Lentibacillus cibarius TaxID=2583219 RepID=A0A5S3R821_9BACI|nr:YhcN/YlaJ family sporulation lipoprotein [Lentibacillus cibarius]TMN23413.1 hypothetical protein FFL34_15895 [Lentibacillus cibarius]